MSIPRDMEEIKNAISPRRNDVFLIFIYSVMVTGEKKNAVVA